MCIVITLHQYSAAVMYQQYRASIPCCALVSTVHQLQLDSRLQVFFTPAITEAGFTKVKMSADLFQTVRNWYPRNPDRVIALCVHLLVHGEVQVKIDEPSVMRLQHARALCRKPRGLLLVGLWTPMTIGRSVFLG